MSDLLTVAENEAIQAENAALKNDKEFLVDQLQKAQAMVRETGEALMETQSEKASIKAQVRGLVEALEKIKENTSVIDFLPEHDKMYFALKRVRGLSTKALEATQ